MKTQNYNDDGISGFMKVMEKINKPSLPHGLKKYDLEKYINLQLDGEEPGPEFRELMQELDSSVAYAEIYAGQYEKILENRLQQVPKPDLSFLKKEKTFLRKLLKAIQNEGQKLKITLNHELVSLLQPMPDEAVMQAVTRTRDSKKGEHQSKLISLESTDFPDLDLPYEVAFSVFEDSHNVDLCSLLVNIDSSQMGASLYDVTLTYADVEQKQTTNFTGEVWFESIPKVELSQLIIEINEVL